MSRLGVKLTVLAGAALPVPLPAPYAARIREVTVTESDGARSAFTVVLDGGRGGPQDALGPLVMHGCPIRANARVILVLTMGPVPQVLMDGIVTEVEFTPGGGGTPAELRATGQDLSLVMDRKEVDVEHIALADYQQVLRIAAGYAAQGITPMVIPPVSVDQPLPMVRTPTQQATDYAHVQQLAARNGHVCYLIPGPAPGRSTLYWGPPVRGGQAQPAISVNLGPATNVTGPMRFREDTAAPATMEGSVTDPTTGAVVPIRTFGSLRVPLAAMPVWAVHATDLRSRRFRESGLGVVAATAQAQAATEAQLDCVTAEGTLDVGGYGSILRPRALVGVRGAGWLQDGLWYVRQVVHRLASGSFTSDFTLAREGYGATVPMVPV